MTLPESQMSLDEHCYERRPVSSHSRPSAPVGRARTEPIDSPPALYDADGEFADDSSVPDHDHDDPSTDHEERCSPWHYHAGLPGRFAWWYYQQVYAEGRASDPRLPCRTPCLLHIWTVDHPDGTYAHGGPPPEYRTRTPAPDPEFETGATPGEDELGWDALPADVVRDRTPDSFRLRERFGR